MATSIIRLPGATAHFRVGLKRGCMYRNGGAMNPTDYQLQWENNGLMGTLALCPSYELDEVSRNSWPIRCTVLPGLRCASSGLRQVLLLNLFSNRKLLFGNSASTQLCALQIQKQKGGLRPLVSVCQSCELQLFISRVIRTPRNTNTMTEPMTESTAPIAVASIVGSLW